MPIKWILKGVLYYSERELSVLNNPPNNIYDELDNLDLDNLFSDDKKKDEKLELNSGKPVIRPEDCLYDKSYICSVCDNAFKARTVRTRKAVFIRSDIDLKSYFEPIQPYYYEVVICNKCGYSALVSRFNKVTQSQASLILNNISKKFIPKNYPDIYTVDIAIERFKLALLNCITMKSKDGEKAYICLKIAWLYREKKDAENEHIYLKSAFRGFAAAFTKESFPICGLNENTVSYIMSALAYELGLNDYARRFLSALIIKRGITAQLKLKIEELRDKLRK